jgi:type I restriction enzyme S subunit
MNLIISIKPKFVQKILAGEKKYEFRRRIYRQKVDKIYIYQTLPEQGIVAYFTPGEIIKDTPQNLWERFSEVSGTTEEHLLSYLHDLNEAYAIEITDLKVYDTPFIPEDIKAPQSYKYIDYDL